MKFLKAKTLLIIVLIGIGSGVYADIVPSAGFIQMSFISAIEQSIPEWMDLTTHAAMKIFTILWCFETFNQIVFKNVLGNNLKQLPIYLITRICFGGFFYALLLKPDFYVGIIQYFGHLTTPIQFNGNILTGFNAGEVFTQFNTWLMKVYTPIQSNLGWSDAGKAVSYAFLCVIYLMCTCVISLMVIILEVEIYMTIFGALVLTGFAGSSWTYGMWNRYLDMVIGLGVRVMVFGMLYGILIKLINIDINTAGSMDVISSTITIILVTMCLWIIPSKIAGIVSGSAAGHSLAEAAGAALGGFALGKRFGFGNKPSGGGGGYPMPNPKSPPVPSPNPNPETPKNPTDNSIPNPGKSAPTKPMPPEYINKNKTK